jgi:membrane associated rhomboid family serine protease
MRVAAYVNPADRLDRLASIKSHRPRTMFDQPRRERMLNVPAVVVALLVVLGVIQAVLLLVLTPEQTTEFLLLFAFIPARYDASVLPDVAWPGGWAADIWTFVTYALIHADLSHLIFNAVWLLAFGSPVAQRFGSRRFLAFMAVTAAAGAAVHLVTHFGELLPMVGASAAISGAMAAATRFAFQRGGPLELWRDPAEACRVPAAPLACARIRAGLVRRQYSVRGLLRGHAGHRTGDRLAGAYRRISGRSFRLRGIRSGSDFDQTRQRKRVGPDTDRSLTNVLANRRA